jgi:hypothetical protein
MNALIEALEQIFRRRAPEISPNILADIYDRLIWCLDDNGDSINLMQRIWLEGNNIDQIRIALAMNEVCPYSTKQALENSIQRIVSSFPGLNSECSKFLKLWDEFLN